MSYHQINHSNQPTFKTSTRTIDHHQIHQNQIKSTASTDLNLKFNQSTASTDLNLKFNQSTASISVSIPTCANCSTQTTPLWRRDESGATLCNACALFQKMKGRPRPISLKTDIIKQRNRIKVIDRDLHHSHSKINKHHHIITTATSSASSSSASASASYQNSKLKHQKKIKLINHQPPPPQKSSQEVSIQSNPIQFKSSPHSFNENDSDELELKSYQSTSKDSQENRSLTHSRKSEPGGVTNLDLSSTSLSKDESNQDQDQVLYHSIGSKRRKEVFHIEPISISKRILNGKPNPKSNQFQSILNHQDDPHIPSLNRSPIALTSIRSASLNNFRSNPSIHKTQFRNSLGSPSDFRFDRELNSQDELCSTRHLNLHHRNEVINHLKVPNLNQLSIHSNLNLSPITSPLGRSISVDPHPNHQTPLSCSSSSSSSNERGRPRTRLPPLSQLVSRTFNETQSPSRPSGPPISFEESAREANYQSPQSQTRVSSSSSSIISTHPLNHHHHMISKRTSSVSSSKSSDTEFWNESNPTHPGVERLLLKPSTPPSFDESSIDEVTQEARIGKEERDEEVYRLKQRVNELERMNGRMKSKLNELEFQSDLIGFL